MRKFSWIWIPRGVIMFYILFLLLLSFDVFQTNQSIWEQIAAFFIHSIPSWIFIIVLILTWKKYIIAGISYIVLGILGMIFFKTFLDIYSFLLVSLPPILIGLSFIIYDKMIKDSE